MRQYDEIDTCPKCGSSLIFYKTKNYKRYVKCDHCKIAYALPKKGSLSNSALKCPERNFPILLVDRDHQKTYFWTDRPCFTCRLIDNCKPVKELIEEFEGLEVHGY